MFLELRHLEKAWITHEKAPFFLDMSFPVDEMVISISNFAI
jgi:hypothetical protein